MFDLKIYWFQSVNKKLINTNKYLIKNVKEHFSSYTFWLKALIKKVNLWQINELKHILALSFEDNWNSLIPEFKKQSKMSNAKIIYVRKYFQKYFLLKHEFYCTYKHILNEMLMIADKEK